VRGEPPSTLRERTRRARAEVCPYQGLEVFREEDAPFFFGREAFTEKLGDAVAAQSLVAVVGRSGSGKSSVVRAGLVPSLRRQDGETVWEVVTMVPGDRPLHALSNALMPLLHPELSERRRLIEIREMAKDFARARLEPAILSSRWSSWRTSLCATLRATCGCEAVGYREVADQTDPACGGALRIIAGIEDLAVIQKIPSLGP
jgi:hypothetical protein